MTKEAFFDHFSNLFVDNGLPTSRIPDVIRHLNLGQDFLTFRRYDEIKDRYSAGKGVLVFSEINLNPGCADVVKHCNVLLHISSDSFTLFIPISDGSDSCGTFQAPDWDAKLCHGLVLL